MSLPSPSGLSRFALCLLVVPLCFGACATKHDPSALAIAPQGIVTTEYEYVTPTGTHIPIRVPKGAKASPTSTASPVTRMNPEVLGELMQRPSGRR